MAAVGYVWPCAARCRPGLQTTRLARSRPRCTRSTTRARIVPWWPSREPGRQGPGLRSPAEPMIRNAKFSDALKATDRYAASRLVARFPFDHRQHKEGRKTAKGTPGRVSSVPGSPRPRTRFLCPCNAGRRPARDRPTRPANARPGRPRPRGARSTFRGRIAPSRPSHEPVRQGPELRSPAEPMIRNAQFSDALKATDRYAAKPPDSPPSARPPPAQRRADRTRRAMPARHAAGAFLPP